VSLLVWNLTLELSGLGDPASSYATAGIALEIIGTRKPHRHDKAETPTGGHITIIIDNNLVPNCAHIAFTMGDHVSRNDNFFNVVTMQAW
jgi:hypothetical protein